MFTAASTPISGPVSSVPAFSTTEPTGMSPPATRTSLPAAIVLLDRHAAVLGARVLLRDDGVGAGGDRRAGRDADRRARLDLRAARRGPRAPRRRAAARTGASVVSPARSAKPSIVEQSNGGTGFGATASCASTRPSASSRSTSSASSRLVCSSSWRRASSIEILIAAATLAPGDGRQLGAGARRADVARRRGPCAGGVLGALGRRDGTGPARARGRARRDRARPGAGAAFACVKRALGVRERARRRSPRGRRGWRR